MKWTYRQRSRRSSPWLRAVAMTLSVVAFSGGISFAALISQQAKLTGNTIQTATANLQLSTDGVSYSDSLVGFSFDGIVPGGQPVPTTGYSVYLKNSGGTPLALKLSVNNSLTNLDNVDLSKVHVILSPLSGGSVQNFTLQALISSYNTGGSAILSPVQLSPSATAQYKLQVSMDSDAVNGPSASINNLEFNFGGTAVSP